MSEWVGHNWSDLAAAAESENEPRWIDCFEEDLDQMLLNSI